jgi:hypothetical protein
MGAFFMGDLNPEACVALLQGLLNPALCVVLLHQSQS